VFPDRIFIYVVYITFHEYHSDDMVETGERWEIIKEFNVEYRKETTTWVHNVNVG
jgi:hypothetical protein